VLLVAKATNPRKRQQGSVDELPSGALRVRVYAGTDPITRRRHDLVEVIPAGPNAWDHADEARRRFLAEIKQRRNPRTSATINQLLDRYLDQHQGGKSTVTGYSEYVDKHVRPFIGKTKVGEIDAEILDSLYAELQRCRDHCKDRRQVHHRTPRPHECDERCRPHSCRPLGNATIRKIHYILSGAYKRAVRWRWVATSPMDQAEPPPVPSPDPQPPTPDEAARLITEAFRLDPDWGMLVWLTMVTGARRGELCGLRWRHVDLERSVVTVRRAIAQDGTATEEKDTKTHQRRHVTIDPGTVAALVEHRQRCEERCAALGLDLSPDAFVFSLLPDGSTHLKPSSLTQRYSRMADRLGIDTHLHNLRHYSATELIAAGVDVRTVAGRLGHGGGGTTTLRVYAAWVAEADQRAAQGLADRLPPRPDPVVDETERAKTNPRSPYERLAVTLRDRIIDGSIAAGQQLPTGKQLAEEFGVATATAQRAVTLLQAWDMVDVSRGRRAVVRSPDRGIGCAQQTDPGVDARGAARHLSPDRKRS
jgi:integrase